MKRIGIIGGGISGLATAYRIQQAFASKGFPLEMIILEAGDRPGGKIQSEHREGYLCEWGPNGFLDSRPDTLELCEDLMMRDRLLPSRDAARRRYICSKGRLHQVPETPSAFFRSNLLSVTGRIRILGELFARPTPAGVDASIYEFGARRIGREATEKLLDPMVSGIFAGDPAVMSLEACFPRIAELERNYGSLVKAMMRLAKERKQQAREHPDSEVQVSSVSERPKAQAGPAGPGGVLTSFHEGLEALVVTLTDRLGSVIHTGCLVQSIEDRGESKAGGRYRIMYQDTGSTSEWDADAVVLAVPAYAACTIISNMEKKASDLLDEIPYSPLIVAGLGFRASDLPGPLDGFGFLIPHKEGRKILGSLWCSSIFPGRAPEGRVLTRTMIGGYRNQRVMELDDTRLVEIVLEEYKEILKWNAPPVYVNIIRHSEAIPVYTLGHNKRLEMIEQLLSRHKGVYLTGNAYRGVALNDCTREAVRIASRVREDLFQHI